jgi:uncharacterized protein YqgC (DUF456 family)
MSLTDSMSTATLVAAVLIVLGLLGVLVPILPGLVLVWAGIGLWCVQRSDGVGWLVLAGATLVLAIGTVVKYALPGRRLRDAGVPWLTLATGGVLGVAGFFVIPVIGLPIGFVAGVYLAERLRLGGRGPAWPSTRQAVAAVGLSMLIEFGAGLLATAIWLAGVLLA